MQKEGSFGVRCSLSPVAIDGRREREGENAPLII
jgi:hypothetical protein